MDDNTRKSFLRGERFVKDCPKYMDSSGETGIAGLWSVSCSAGIVEGNQADLDRIHRIDGTYIAEYDGFRLEAAMTCSQEDVCIRDDRYVNTSDEIQRVQLCLSRFALPGGEYEIYTQANAWQNESEGAWTKLVSKASAWNRGLRSGEGCAPVLALWNEQTRRGVIFHIFSSCSWKLTASVESCGGTDTLVVVEAGVSDRGLDMEVAPGETVCLPRIVYYVFEDKRDLDSWRLHAWFNRTYPRRSQPVIFNTWMMSFDWLETENICHQADLAAELGAEYFVVDAGWFGGDRRWDENIGEWTENTTGAFCGRMREVADHIRGLGMKFGLWIEPERALQGVTNVREHPEWFFTEGTAFFADFSNDDLRKHLTKTVLELIARYGIEFIKFDFNAGISYDPSHAGFLRWHIGHERFLNDLRTAYPNLYLEDCASGGQRMDLYNLTLYDSVWLSDNHSVYDQVRIQKDTMVRLPMCCMERWPVIKDGVETISYTEKGLMRQLIACDDCAWFTVRGVRECWLDAFTTGGPLGLSFNLAELSSMTFDSIRALIVNFKKYRDFWRTARSRILCDTQRVLAIQYESVDLQLLCVVVFSWRRRQKDLTLFPITAMNLTYNFEEQSVYGATLQADGLRIQMPDGYGGAVLWLNGETEI